VQVAKEFYRRNLKALRQIVQSEKCQIDVSALYLAEIRLGKARSLGERLLLEISFPAKPSEIQANQFADIHEKRFAELHAEVYSLERI
jgi:hypothetical protein